ncbi:MAG: hypothetical protein KJ964_12155 [Verrucomicrobia bacterium]|nr:hypothetical protein [Verrucomicrobiota bacterium]
MPLLIGLAYADITVDSMDDAACFSATPGIKPLGVETKEGISALHMSFECAGKGTLWITRQFKPVQDWRGYGILNWKLMVNSTGARTHLQAQIFDVNNNEILMRKEFSGGSYGKWLDITWDFSAERPVKEGKSFDFSHVKSLIFSAWQDYYGHQKGDKVDYWISNVRRERSWQRAGLGVAPAVAPPVIDGRLNDPVWETTPVAEQFYRPGGSGLPKSQTSMRLLWDKANLYIGFKSHSILLDPVQQRLNDFVAKTTERDGPIWSEDNVEIFIAPAQSPETYLQFALNALGTRYDGKITESKWDGAWQAATCIHDGYWTAELALPWSTLGITPGPGLFLRANFFRTDVLAGKVETSGWSPVQSSHNQTEAFGDIYLLPEPPVVVVASGTVPEMVVGANQFTPTVRGIKGGAVAVRWYVMQDKKRNIEHKTINVAAGEKKQVKLDVVVDSPGEVETAYSLFNADTDALYLQTPAYKFKSAAVARLEIRMLGEAEVFCNAVSLVRRSSADNYGRIRGFLRRCFNFGGKSPANYATFLQQGVNVIGLKAGEPVDVTVITDGLELGGGWKQSAEAPAGWLETGFDDTNWQPAVVKNGRLDPAAGRFFRRVLATESTKILMPAPSDLYIAGGSAQHLPIVIGSPLPRALREAKLVLELPEGLEWVDWGDKQPPGSIGAYTGHVSRSVSYRQEQWRRHEFKWEEMKPVAAVKGMHPFYTTETFFTMGFVIRDTGSKPARKEHFRMWVEGEGGSVLELPRSIPLTVLAPLKKAKRPARIDIQLAHAFGAGGYEEEEISALMDTWRDVGFTSYQERTGNHKIYNPLLRERGFKIIAEWVNKVGFNRSQNKDTKFVGYDGKGSHYFALCPSWMTGEGRSAAVAAVAEAIRESAVPPDGFFWDLEFGPKHCCFCDRCIGNFAERYQITEKLTPELILEKHAEQWVNFWCKVWADITGMFRDGLKAVVPDGRMYLYSAYQDPGNRRQYCIDWTLAGPACDVAVAGYGWNQETIGNTVSALKGKPLLGGVLYYLPPRRMDLKLEYVKLILSGCSGVMQYTWAPMDGLDYMRVSEAIALLAEYEEFFVDGVRDDAQVSGPPVQQFGALRLGGRLLVLVLNSTAEPRNYRLSIKNASDGFEEYPGGQKINKDALTSKEGVEIVVPAYDIKVLVGRIGADTAK